MDSLNRCGGGGIRTREGLAPLLAFQASALGHYATPPENLLLKVYQVPGKF
jgi:hypothetical protein